ncbi:MAG TPA: Wzz/FepE/Etk N-terminal domain-containing protein, partial [Planctomycetota bacterium]|nr:Wzz/FepE/Etk N-terminal domain-containing protein [Planctomycetota bacterium]
MSDTTATNFEPAEAQPNELSDWLGALFTLWPIVRRYWWIVAVVAICVMSLTGLYLFTRPDLYRADATIVLTPGLGQKSDSDLSDLAGPKDLNVFTNTQLQLLRSNEVIDRAIDTCGAASWAEFEGMDRTQLEKKIATALDINLPAQTALLNVSTLSTDPTHSQSMVNAVCASYLDKCKKVMHEIRGERATQQQTAGESPQVRYLDICRQVDDFMRDNAISPDQTNNPFEMERQQLIGEKDEADRAVAVLQQQADLAIKAQKQYTGRTISLSPEELRKPENDITELLMLPRVLNDLTIQKMTQDIFTAEGLVAGTQASLGPDNLGLKAQQEMLWTLRRMRREQVQATLDGTSLELMLAQQKAADVGKDFFEVQDKYDNWRNSLIKLNDLLRQKREAETTYEDVRSNRDRSQILSRMDMLPASTWSEASLPMKPYDQQALLKMVLALFGGVVLGVLTAVAYDRMDSSIRTR